MSNSKPPKSPQDIIFEDVDDFNKVSYRQHAQKQLIEANKASEKVGKEEVVAEQIQKYEESFRNYYYLSQILTDSKSNDFFQEALREVHPTIKLKSTAKNTLKIVNKIFAQELAETCFEIISKRKDEKGSTDVDQEVVEDAARLMEKRRVKNTKFARLFNEMC